MSPWWRISSLFESVVPAEVLRNWIIHLVLMRLLLNPQNLKHVFFPQYQHQKEGTINLVNLLHDYINVLWALPPDRLNSWGWGMKGDRSCYHALFPRAWTTYQEPDPQILLTCKQISPVHSHTLPSHHVTHHTMTPNTPHATQRWYHKIIGRAVFLCAYSSGL